MFLLHLQFSGQRQIFLIEKQLLVSGELLPGRGVRPGGVAPPPQLHLLPEGLLLAGGEHQVAAGGDGLLRQVRDQSLPLLASQADLNRGLGHYTDVNEYQILLLT